MSAPDFRFDRRGKRLVAWAALGASLGFLGVATLQDNLLLVIGAVVLALPFLFWSLLAVPIAGVAVSETRLRWWEGPDGGEIALSDIDRAETAGIKGSRIEGVVLHLSDGTLRVVPGQALPPNDGLLLALRARGVRVR